MIRRFRDWLANPEVIGPPECPILMRWTIYGEHGLFPFLHLARSLPLIFDRKLMIHHFMPNADDRDPHDHPRPFTTFVVRGAYVNRTEDGDEYMTPGRVRHRRATHTHITKVSTAGCWTVVLMGPFKREWGFWREGKWWRVDRYERMFGFGMRCD